MFETIITIAIVIIAGFWFLRWFCGRVGGKGCSGCGKCSRGQQDN